jgi:hypothetical protein
MLDPSAHHSEPFGEAFSYSSQRAAQMISMIAAAAEVALRRRAMHAARQATRDEQRRRVLQAQEGAFRAQVRARWAQALDARWLAQADLLQAGRAWGAAAPWAENDPEAAAALRRTEERLRTLHPYAMGRYDRLRSEGASPLDAMREAAQLFAREPRVRPGQPTPGRFAVEVGLPGIGTPSEAGTAADPNQSASRLDPYLEVERRGRAIVERLQARALHERGALLSPGELATALEESTSLPAEVIAGLAHAEVEDRVAVAAERACVAELGHAAVSSGPVQAGDLAAVRRSTVTAETAGTHSSADRTAAQLAAESFPCSAADGIRAAATGRGVPTQSADRIASVDHARRISVSP